MLVLPKTTCFLHTFNVRSMFPFFPATLISFHVHRRQKSSVDSQKSIPNFGTFPIHFQTVLSRIAFLTSPGGCPYRFLSRGTTGSSILDQDLSHLCRGRGIQSLHIQILEFSMDLVHLPCRLECTLILRLLLALRIQEVWQWLPLLLRPSFAMQKPRE